MSLIKPEDINKLKESGKRLSLVLDEVIKATKVGVKTSELDELAERLIAEGGDKPAFKNYQPSGASIPFPATLCVSVNDEIVHGIPGDRELEDGDIVGLDLGLSHEGIITDMAVTVCVGNVSDEVKKLVTETKRALDASIKVIKAGNHLGDIGHEIETIAKQNEFGLVDELGGHGVGYSVHDAPFIPNWGTKGTGVALEEGMVLAIEPMLTLGHHKVKEKEDMFTIATDDGSLSAHFEVTVLVTKAGCDIITPQLKINS